MILLPLQFLSSNRRGKKFSIEDTFFFSGFLTRHFNGLVCSFIPINEANFVLQQVIGTKMNKQNKSFSFYEKNFKTVPNVQAFGTKLNKQNKNFS